MNGVCIQEVHDACRCAHADEIETRRQIVSIACEWLAAEMKHSDWNPELVKQCRDDIHIGLYGDLRELYR